MHDADSGGTFGTLHHATLAPGPFYRAHSSQAGERIAAEEPDAGVSFVNENLGSDPPMPFGGVKHSGYGRECAGFGIRELVKVKSVLVRT